MKKILSLVLTFAILITMCVSMGITVFAESSYENKFDTVTVTSDNKIFDGETEMFNQVELLGDSTNKYIKGLATKSNAFFFKAGSVTISDVALLDFDVNIGESETFELLVSGNNNYRVLNYISTKGFYNYNDGATFVSKENVSEGWHKVRILLNYGKNYSVFIDGNLVLDKASFSITMSSSRKGLKFTTTSGVDNLKYYNTAADVPYNISVSGTYGVGEKLTASASAWESPNHASQTLEYKYVSSSTLDGEYSDISSGVEYTLQTTDEGKYVKAAVRSTDGDAVYSEWIYSEPMLVTGEPVTPFEWTDSQTTVYIPNGTDEFKYQYTHNNGGDDDKTPQLSGDNTGITATDYNENGYVLTFTGNASAGSAQLVSHADETQPVSITLKKTGIYDFEDGLTTGFTRLPIIAEKDGNKYLSYDAEAYSRYYFTDYSDLTGTVAIDFDILTEKSNSVTLYMGTGQEITLEKVINLPLFKDRSMSGEFYEVPEGWNHVRIFLDLDKKLYSMFINDIALSVNNEITGYTENESAKLDRIQFWSPIDNFTFANVTPVTPVAYNAKLTNIAAGVENTADFDFYLGSVSDKCSTYKWYVSENYESGYNLVAETKAFTPTSDMIGKYVKAEITPSTEAFCTTFTGSAVTTKPQRIVDVELGGITLTVGGEVANIKKANITSAGAEVVVTIPASYTNGAGKEVIFALAQYDGNGLKSLASDTVSLTAASQNIILKLKAEKVDDLYPLKLMVLDKETLTPLNNVIFLR